jgi:hypothetical protein
LDLLRQWGSVQRGSGTGPSGRHHETCGSDLELRWWCPTCARTVDDDEAGDLHHL